MSTVDWTDFSGKVLPTEKVQNVRNASIRSPGQCVVGPVDGSDPFSLASLQYKVWFTSPIFTSHIIHRLDTLTLTTFASSQGEVEDPAAGNYSWFELAIFDSPNFSHPRIVDNRLLVWRSHENDITTKEKKERNGTTFGKNHEIWGFFNEGNVIAVRVCARFAGWANDAKWGRLDIVVAETPVSRARKPINIQHALGFQPLEPRQGLGGPRLRLLSLDGGGVRGIASLHILKRLMFLIAGDENAKPCDYFDMIAGTSTGGIIAIMLGRLRLTVPECIKAYKKLSEQIFDDSKLKKMKRGLGTGARYSQKRFVAAVEEFLTGIPGFNKDSRMLDPDGDGCKVFVLACDASNTQNQLPVYLRTYSNPKANNPISATIVQAARATSAAPTYFKHQEIDGKSYIDGGLAANNPTQFLVLEARSYFGEGRPYASVVSLGTGQQPRVQIKGGITGSLGLLFYGSWAAMVTGTEITHLIAEQDPQLKGIYFRYNPGKWDATLSDWKAPIDLADWRNMHTIVTWTLDYLKDHQVDQDMKTCVNKIKAVDPLHACSPAPIIFQKKDKESDNLQPVTNVSQAVIAAGKLWDNTGGTIKITYGFLSSEPDDRKTAVSTTIATWERYANVHFEHIQEDWTKADIRISFDASNGSWSAVGTDATNEYFKDKATMNFGWLKNNANPSVSDKGTILHEFGHALGMMHEHQSPARGRTITLNEREVYRYYRPLLQNRDDLVKSQVIDVYRLSQVSNYSHFDEKSIMMYAMPGFLNEQKRDIQPNHGLSDLDKAFIMLNYPGSDKETDMTLDKALTISGVLTGPANTIKVLVEKKDFKNAREHFIKSNKEARESAEVNANYGNFIRPISTQSTVEWNEEFKAIIEGEEYKDIVGVLVKQVLLQHNVVATKPGALLPDIKLSEDYVSGVVDALIVHPAIVGAVDKVLDTFLAPVLNK